MAHPVKTCRRIAQAMLALLLLSTTLLMSACGGGSQVQQGALQSQARFDQQLKHAQQIGVPASLLQPLLRTEQQLRSSSPPFNLFNNQPADTYYYNRTTRYSLLTSQLQALITTSTDQAKAQTQQDLLDFQAALQHSHTQNLPTGNFSPQLGQTQTQFLKAQNPKDYVRISSQIHDPGTLCACGHGQSNGNTEKGHRPSQQSPSRSNSIDEFLSTGHADAR